MPTRGATMDDYNITAWIGHSLSGAAILGTLAGWFPPIAAVVAFIWYSIQIWESDTVQKYRSRRRARKIARYKAALTHLEELDKKKQ